MPMENLPNDFMSDADKKKKKSQEGLSNVINELKNVLSDLNSNPSTPTPPSPTIITPDSLIENNLPENFPGLGEPTDQPSSFDFNSDQSSEVLGDAAFQQASKSNVEETPDSDFWSGNVLGWPTPGVQKEVPELKPKEDLFPKVEERAFQPLEPKSEPSFSPFMPEALEEIEKEPEAPKIEPILSPQSKKFTTESFDAMFPAPPQSPLEKNFLTEENDESPMPIILPKKKEKSLAEAFSEMDKELGADENSSSTSSLAPEKPLQAAPALPQASPIPIPRNIELSSLTNDASKNPNEPVEEEVKPEGLIQIACLFPQGEEKKGQEFVNKLKELCKKSSKGISIEPVYINGWAEKSLDLSACVKTAQISGSDMMYILAPRAQSGLFKDLTRISTSENLPARVVYIEQIALKNLYADLYVDLSRRKNGKG